MKTNLRITLATVVLAALALTGCQKFSEQKANQKSTTSGSTVMACDESFQRIMEQEIDVFEYIYPDASILSRYLPENQCIDSLVNSKDTRLAVVTRELTPVEVKALKARKRTVRTTRIAVDAIAIIVNPENPIEVITTSDLGKILAGEIREWKWVEPGNPCGDIRVVFDYNGSSTVNYMTDSIMDGRPYGDIVHAQNDNAKVFEYVSRNRGAIGIIGVSWVNANLNTAAISTEDIARQTRTWAQENHEKTDEATDSIPYLAEFDNNVKVLAVAGPGKFESEAVKPYQAYIYDGQYPLVRSIYMITTGSPSSPAGGFYSFVTGVDGQNLIMKTGVLPGSVRLRIVEVE